MNRPLDSAVGRAARPDTRTEGDSQWLDQLARLSRGGRWMGWRLRVLVGAALLGSIALFLLARWLGDAPAVAATWTVDAQGRLKLAASRDPALGGSIGKELVEVSGNGAPPASVDALTLRRSSRWIIDGEERARHRQMHLALAQALTGDAATLRFSDGSSARVPVHRRGTRELGGGFWLFGGFALAVYLVSMVVWLARPTLANLLYALMSSCQSGNLAFIAIESTLSLGLPSPVPWLDMPLRMAFDLTTAAAIVTAVALYPLRLPGARAIAATAWLVAGGCALLPALDLPGDPWWRMQGVVLALGGVALGLLTWSLHRTQHPFTLLMRRFGTITVGTLALLIGALELARRSPGMQHDIASAGSMIWYVFFAGFQLLLPLLSKSRQVVREFALLAAVSTVATSLDLLFVAVFSLGQFTSLTLSLFLALGLYAGSRQWLLNQILGHTIRTTERMFEQLYRIAREVELHPQRATLLLTTLLRELFEPMRVMVVDQRLDHARVVQAGAAMVLPVPRLGVGDDESTPPQAISLHFAGRGRRLFTTEDARLAERIVDQLRRAVAFDKAVEQGRTEERTRIAQDLHDDIGARLLTLMYRAANPEIEEYVRHTLKDLKTLTRGLAADNHRLSHAAGEWKADLSQRLTVAHIALAWHFDFDDDVLLTVVQWSALTRVLRELVSNTIAHSRASRVEVRFHLAADALRLTVTDDGIGRNPRAWSHGLGLGGVRKRVKQLGGDVDWHDAAPNGVVCTVTIAGLSSPR